MQPWVTIPLPSFLERQSKLKVTIYGPYGKYEQRLRNIALQLRENHKFANTYLVKDRHGHRPQLPKEDEDVYLLAKSFHYLRISDVNIFIFYCWDHNESVGIQLKEVCDNIKWKRSCCAIMLDESCDMATLLDAQIKISNILVDRFDGKKVDCDNQILQFAFAKCNIFLKSKFDSLG